MRNKTCVVVFPVYKSLTETDRTFLENGLSLTQSFCQVLVAPNHLVIDESFGDVQSLPVIRFDDYYFESIQGYNRLLLSEEFYIRFDSYEYLLIHQADVYLFHDNLLEWCNKGYDYIGAPWYKSSKLNKGSFYSYLFKKVWQKYYLSPRRKNGWLYNKVGNGGLSLRKTSSALSVLKSTPSELLEKYRRLDDHNYNEDVFWSVEAIQIIPEFKIPKWNEALAFAVESNPREAVEALNNKLPFGCHDPKRMDAVFWAAHIPILSI